MSFIDTDDPFSIAAKRIRSSVIRSAPEPQLPIQGKQQPTTYIIEPDLMESQTGKMNLPNDVAFDDAGFAYNTVTGNPVQVVRRPNVLPIARTPDGFTFAMPKILDAASNIVGGVAAPAVATKAGEVVLGSGAVRTMPEAVKEITPFYSALERTVDNAKIGKADANQWLGYLKNQPGVKQEELQYVLGNLPEGQISKQALADIIKNNKIELKEVVKGFDKNSRQEWTKKFESEMERSPFGDDELYSFSKNPTKYHDYQLPGGSNYQEMLLTLPDTRFQLKRLGSGRYAIRDTDNNQFIKDAGGAGRSFETAEAAKAEIAHLNNINESKNTYRSSHWDEPNILAHVRYNDRNIPDVGKSLHLEEIQSDWHQAGRKQGYVSNKPLSQDELQELGGLKGASMGRELTPVEDARYSELLARNGEKSGLVPDAPFKKNWDELAFKRMLHKAANEGYDSISWTPGEAQAARYDLSKQIDQIHINPGIGDTTLVRLKANKGDDISLQINDKGDVVSSFPGSQTGQFEGKNLTDVVGKEVAEKIMSKAADRPKRPDNLPEGYELIKDGNKWGVIPPNQNHARSMVGLHDNKEEAIRQAINHIHSEATQKGHILENADLKIGGEGMKSFYDKMLVDKANSLAKKYGAKVETKNISTQQGKILKRPDGSGFYISYPSGSSKTFTTIEEAQSALNGQPVHVLKFTPELRAKAKEGFPLFSSTPITTPVDYDPFNNNKKYKLTPIEGDPFK